MMGIAVVGWKIIVRGRVSSGREKHRPYFRVKFCDFVYQRI